VYLKRSTVKLSEKSELNGAIIQAKIVYGSEN